MPTGLAAQWPLPSDRASPAPGTTGFQALYVHSSSRAFFALVSVGIDDGSIEMSAEPTTACVLRGPSEPEGYTNMTLLRRGRVAARLAISP
jgi:hypothetical protein